MYHVRYDMISRPQKSAEEYIESLNNDELLSVYYTSSSYGIKIPSLIKKIQRELMKRNLQKQSLLF